MINWLHYLHGFPWLYVIIQFYIQQVKGSSQICLIQVLVCRLLLALSWILLTISFSALQQWPANLTMLLDFCQILNAGVLYNRSLVSWSFQVIFKATYVWKAPSNLLSRFEIRVHHEHPFNRIEVTAAWKRLFFMLSESLDFHIKDNMSTAP